MDAVYPNDLNDSEWGVLRPLLPTRKPWGRKREVELFPSPFSVRGCMAR